MDGRAAFLKVTRDAIGNVIFYGIAAVAIIGVGSYVRWLGIVLFGIDVLLTAFTVAQVGFSSVLGLILLVRNVVKRLYNPDDFWWYLANVIALAECGFHIGYAVIMYRYLFGSG